MSNLYLVEERDDPGFSRMFVREFTPKAAAATWRWKLNLSDDVKAVVLKVPDTKGDTGTIDWSDVEMWEC
jgi:hypothetical protein